jgi:hypothetical protein
VSRSPGQAMEPSTRRCVTQAVRLASSGYVLLEFQRVTSDNITGYVEANRCVRLQSLLHKPLARTHPAATPSQLPESIRRDQERVCCCSR